MGLNLDVVTICVASMIHYAIYRLLTINDKADKTTEGVFMHVSASAYE